MPETLTPHERELIEKILQLTAELKRSTRSRKPDRKYAGPAPYGFTRKVVDGEKQLVEEPGEQAIIVAIEKLRAKDYGLKVIAETLNEAGKRTRHGGEFVLQDIARILKGRGKFERRDQ